MNVRDAAITAGLVLLAVTTTAHADVDAEIVGNAKVSGTLAPEGEVETLRFDATAGSTLTLGIAAKKKAPLDFTLTLYGPDDEVVPFDAATKVIDKDKKVAVKKLPLTQTGSYRLEVTATGTGEYALKLKAAPAKKLSREITLDAGAGGEAAIAAPAGSTVTIRATAAKGEPTLPRIDMVGGIDVGDLPGPKGSKHSVKVVLGPDDGGDLMVALTNTATDNGTIALQAQIKPPKVQAAKLDVRGFSRGAPTGGETVVVRAIGVAGGTVGVADESSRIAGTLVTVPAGALVDPAAISISTADPIAPPNDGVQSAGEAVEFGPDGLEFETPATVVLPFDASALPIGADPENDITVLRQTSSGETEIIPPTAVDVEAGTVTVPASGFSTFMAIIPAGPPNLEGNEYWFLGFSIGLSPDVAQNADSRARDVDMTLGTLSFGPHAMDDEFAVDLEYRDVTWTHDQDGVGSRPIVESGDDVEVGRWEYLPDGRTIGLLVGGDVGEFVPSRDGTYLLGGTYLDEGEGSIALDVAVRKQTGNTLASLAGTYYLGGGECSAYGDVGFGPLEVWLSRLFATFTLRADGSWSLSGVESYAEFLDGRFEFARENFKISGMARIGGPADGRYEDALIFFEPDPDPDDGSEDEPNVLVALPGQGGVLLVSDLEPFGEGHLFLVGVRATSGVTKSVLDGEYETISLEIEPTTYDTFPAQGAPVTIGDYGVCAYHTVLDFDGKGHATEVGYTGVCHFRDEGETDGIRSDSFSGLDEEDSFTVKVASDGKLTIPGKEPTLGATVRDGSFWFAVEDPRSSTRYHDFVFGVRPPVFIE